MAESTTSKPVYVLGLLGSSQLKDAWLAVTDFSLPDAPRTFSQPLALLRVKTDFLGKESKHQQCLDKKKIMYVRVANSERTTLASLLGCSPNGDLLIAPPGTFALIQYQECCSINQRVYGIFEEIQFMKASSRDPTFDNHHQEFGQLISRLKAQCNLSFYHHLDSVYDFRRFLVRKRPHIAQLLQAPVKEVKRPDGAALMFGQGHVEAVDSQKPLFPETQVAESEELSEIEEIDSTLGSEYHDTDQPTPSNLAEENVDVLQEKERDSSLPMHPNQIDGQFARLLGSPKGEQTRTMVLLIKTNGVSNRTLANEKSAQSPTRTTVLTSIDDLEPQKNVKTPRANSLRRNTSQARTPRSQAPRANTFQADSSQPSTPRFKSPRANIFPTDLPRENTPRANTVRSGIPVVDIPSTIDDCALLNRISITTANLLPWTMEDVSSNRDFEIQGFIIGMIPHEPFIIKPFDRTLKVAPFKLLVSEEIDSISAGLTIEFHHETEICSFLLVKEVEEIYSKLESVEGRFYHLIQSKTPIRFIIRRKALLLQNNLLIPYWSCRSHLLDLILIR